ncbi:hypothetical protein GCM10022291_09990 [Postechiella marina]|uniref:Secretion system C-terminal sorting domain-containing protein n=1 Tax=Postechiella marina TaxID=943941 RepID=A0ABP8C464_9FLAO
MKKYKILYGFVFFCYLGIGQNVTKVGYFFNTDLGVGTETIINADSNTGTLTQSLSIPTNTLPEGFNSLYVRTQNSDGNWGLYDRKVFYLKSLSTSFISAAEYFFDVDRGVGNETALVIDNKAEQTSQIYTISTTGLSDGFHSFYLRTQDNDGNWGIYDRRLIYIKEFDFSLHEVIKAEYFIDTDPGVGNGTSITFTDAAQTSQTLDVSTSNSLANGEHLFYVRVQDSNGDWSIYDTEVFTVDSGLGIDDNLFKTTKLFPNPFKNELTIKLNDNIAILKVEIYNKLGQTVFSNPENIKTLNLSNLKSGIYILNLETDIGKASFKIIKK